MLTRGPAKRVVIFLNEDTRHHLTPLHDAVMTFLMHKEVAGATATRAYSGFGGHQTLHTPKIEVLAEHLPIRIEFVETAEKVEEVLPTLYEMVTDGLIEVQDTTVVKLSRPATEAEPGPPHERRAGPAKSLRVFLGEADQVARRTALRCDREEAAYAGDCRRHRLSRHSGLRRQGT
jgi:PII-like signaling protein